jgi:hypothetical protein
MAIRIKRSTGNVAPSTLAGGQLAYVEGTNNTLYIGNSAGDTVIAIGGKADHDKLAGVEAGAQVNTVTSVAGRTGAVVITTADLANFNTASDARIAAANITALADVNIPTTPSNGQVLTWNNSTTQWEAAASGGGVTAFTQLNDVPNSYTSQGLKFVRVNSGATALEFVSDIDDGTF